MKTKLSGVAGMMRDSYNFFITHTRQLLGLSLIMQGMHFIAQLIILYSREPSSEEISLGAGTTALMFTIAGLVFTVFAYGALILFVRDQAPKRDIAPYLKAAAGRFWDVLWTYILMTILIILGLILFIIPGIILVISYSFAFYIVMNENKSGYAALKRSMELISGNWWAVLGRFLALGLIVIIFLIPQFILEYAVDSYALISAIYGFAITLIFNGITIVYGNKIYNDLLAGEKTKVTESQQ